MTVVDWIVDYWNIVKMESMIFWCLCAFSVYLIYFIFISSYKYYIITSVLSLQPQHSIHILLYALYSIYV